MTYYINNTEISFELATLYCFGKYMNMYGEVQFLPVDGGMIINQNKDTKILISYYDHNFTIEMLDKERENLIDWSEKLKEFLM